MAFLHKGPSLHAGRVYNVEQAVGQGGTNASGDVKLVQYMLRNIYGQPAAGLVVDGYIGPVTMSWIHRFQKDARAKGVNVLADGRIDRAMAQISTVSKTTYTVLVMNAELRRSNPAAYQSIPQAVPLNPNPKPTPYVGEGKQVVDMKTVWSALGKVVKCVFSDGSQYPPVGSPSPAKPGKLIFEPAPEPKPGQLIFQPAPPEPDILSIIYYPKMNKTQYVFTDGTIAWTQGPPGGVTDG
jgi:hypothetical protein